jgi:hypothetical protein
MFRLSMLSALSLVAAAAFAQPPSDQWQISFPDATVTSIQFIPAGPFHAPAPQIAPILRRKLTLSLPARGRRDEALFGRPHAREAGPPRNSTNALSASSYSKSSQHSSSHRCGQMICREAIREVFKNKS